MYIFASNISLFLSHFFGIYQFLFLDRKIGHQQNVELDAMPPSEFKIILKASMSLVFKIVICCLVFLIICSA